MNRPNHDPSIEHEPHLRGGGFVPDPTESVARQNIDDAHDRQNEDDRVDHSVWDEPGLSSDLAGQPPIDGLTYAGWLEKRINETDVAYSWGMVLLMALAAGPWAFLGAFATPITSDGQTAFGVLMITVIGPVSEEMMKVAMALWVVERRPFLFQSRLQIAVCVLAAAFFFSAVENVLYLKVYISDPSELLIRWRWTICVALHMGCSLIAGLGLMRIWQSTMETRTRPVLASGAAYMVTAMVIHGVYNGFTIVLSMLDYHI